MQLWGGGQYIGKDSGLWKVGGERNAGFPRNIREVHVAR